MKMAVAALEVKVIKYQLLFIPEEAKHDSDIEDKLRRFSLRRLSKQVQVGNRHYIIKTKPKTLQQIDKPQSVGYKALIAHSSEDRWSIPTDDSHHFSKFPQEIKNAIFGFALTVETEIKLFTVKTNWKTNFCLPHYDVSSEDGVREYGVNYSSIA